MFKGAHQICNFWKRFVSGRPQEYISIWLIVMVFFFQGWLQRLGIQIEGGQGFLLDKLVTAAGELNLPVRTPCLPWYILYLYIYVRSLWVIHQKCLNEISMTSMWNIVSVFIVSAVTWNILWSIRVAHSIRAHNWITQFQWSPYYLHSPLQSLYWLYTSTVCSTNARCLPLILICVTLKGQNRK